jgi:hypothetical protein
VADALRCRRRMERMTAVFLYFRVLAEPNPAREGRREWRVKEIAQRASALAGRPHPPGKVSTTLANCFKNKGYAHKLPGPITAVWCLTEEARVRPARVLDTPPCVTAHQSSIVSLPCAPPRRVCAPLPP